MSTDIRIELLGLTIFNLEIKSDQSSSSNNQKDRPEFSFFGLFPTAPTRNPATLHYSKEKGAGGHKSETGLDIKLLGLFPPPRSNHPVRIEKTDPKPPLFSAKKSTTFIDDAIKMDAQFFLSYTKKSAYSIKSYKDLDYLTKNFDKYLSICDRIIKSNHYRDNLLLALSSQIPANSSDHNHRIHISDASSKIKTISQQKNLNYLIRENEKYIKKKDELDKDKEYIQQTERLRSYKTTKSDIRSRSKPERDTSRISNYERDNKPIITASNFESYGDRWHAGETGPYGVETYYRDEFSAKFAKAKSSFNNGIENAYNKINNSSLLDSTRRAIANTKQSIKSRANPSSLNPNTRINRAILSLGADQRGIGR